MGELLGEIVLGFVSLVVGFLIGSVVFVLVRIGRWALLGSERRSTVVDPRGERWLVRITLMPHTLRFWASQRMLGMRHRTRRERETANLEPDSVSREEIWHPKTLVDKTEEAASIVALAVLAFAIVTLAVFALEAVVVFVGACLVALVRLIWGRWRCEVIDATGERVVATHGSLRETRDAKTELARAIAAGRHPLQRPQRPT